MLLNSNETCTQNPLALAFNLSPEREHNISESLGTAYISCQVQCTCDIIPNIEKNSLTWLGELRQQQYSARELPNNRKELTSCVKAHRVNCFSHPRIWLQRKVPVAQWFYTFNSARLLFVIAGEGLLFSPSVAHREVSMMSRRGMQRARRIVLYSFLKFWLSSPYMMALRQLLK